MPHFFAIAMYRASDYAAAALPVLPVKRGMRVTKIQILIYIVLFAVACVSLSVFGPTGYVFAIAMTAIGAIWFWRGWRGYPSVAADRWGRGMFKFSLVVLLSLSVMLTIGALLP